MSNGVPCKHLEALLPQMNDGKTRYIGDEVAASTSMSVFQVMFPVHSPEVMLDRVKNYGILDKWDLELFEAKYFHNLSLRDIAKKFGYVSTMTVQRRLKRIQLLLVERGYKQELE
jgi:hypothetical protein